MVKAPSSFRVGGKVNISIGSAGTATATNNQTTPKSRLAPPSCSSSSSYYNKFKPWRRGKSSKKQQNSSSTNATLKQQIRSLRRLQQQHETKKLSLRPNESTTENRTADIVEEVEQPDATTAVTASIQQKIDILQQQIRVRNISILEQKNATKSHKVRFVDRQRTTRLYKQLMSQKVVLQQQQELHEQQPSVSNPMMNTKDTNNDNTTVTTIAAVAAADGSMLEETKQQQQLQQMEYELYKLALDQVYIAHYPLDVTSYVSIYQNGTNVRRQIMNHRLLYKMATQRQCVLERIQQQEQPERDPHHHGTTDDTELLPMDHDGETITTSTTPNGESTRIPEQQQQLMKRVNWIHPSQYERIRHVNTWSTQLERTTFDIVMTNHINDNNNNAATSTIKTSDDVVSNIATATNTTATATTKKTTTTANSINNKNDGRFHMSTDQVQRWVQEQERVERELVDVPTATATISTMCTTKESRKLDMDETDDGESYVNTDDDDDDDEADPCVIPQSSKNNAPHLYRQSDDKQHDGDHDDNDGSSSSSNDDDDDSDVAVAKTIITAHDGTNYHDNDDLNGRNKINHPSTGMILDVDVCVVPSVSETVMTTATSLRALAAQKVKTMSKPSKTNSNGDDDDDDDFLVAAAEEQENGNDDDDNNNVFAYAKRHHVPARDEIAMGDKSQGWATQKQLPGQFRKKRRR
jgi:hypothetical protein